MIALALDFSSARGSAALLRDGSVLSSESWNEREVHGQRVFDVLPVLLSGAGLTAAGVDLFVVGRGPGSYSGLRVAMTAAQFLALPGGRPVYALSSGEALAAEAGDGLVAVFGDARRGSAWLGLFRVDGGIPAGERSWELVPLERLPASLPEGCTAISSQWSRLEPFLKRDGRTAWIEKDVFPRAEVLGRLALDRARRAVPSEPLSPIYLHAAVAAAPASGRPAG